MVEASERIKNYFMDIEKKALREYNLASEARNKGFDPKNHVEISLARNVGERIAGLIGALYPDIKGKGLPERILKLEEEFEPGDWRVALTIAKEVVQGNFIKLKSKVEMLELATRVGLAYLTQGVVSAPLEGIIAVKAKARNDEGEYISVYYAGPIRAAGGTPMTVSVVLVDYLRKILGFKKYDPTFDEIKRYYHELDEYNGKVSRLQYFPSEEEVDFLVRNVPIEINGSPTEDREVLIYKDLERVETPKIRGGMCLVLAEGIAGRAHKLWGGLSKFSSDFGLGSWRFLKDYIDLKKKIYSGSKSSSKEEVRVKPSSKYLRDAVGGRPIFSYPSHDYGFRIRYGRTRVSGVESYGFNPATMRVLNNFLAIGTQLSIERPGKGCSVSVCDVIRGPVVLLKDGSVCRVDTVEDYEKYYKKIDKILFLGDVLINYGAFREHNHVLVPSPFVEEWWIKEIKSKCDNPEEISKKTNLPVEFVNSLFENVYAVKVCYDNAKVLSKIFDVPIHPDFTFFWKLISVDDLLMLSEGLSKKNIVHKLTNDNKLVIKYSSDVKRILEDLLVPHKVSADSIILDYDISKALFDSLGYDNSFDKLKKVVKESSGLTVLEIINKVSFFKVFNVCGFTMGARMGRPEKAKMRKMKASPHFLFPVGEQGGRLRSINCAVEEGYIKNYFPLFFCENCNSMTIFGVCEKCDNLTVPWRICNSCKTYTSEEEHCNNPTVPYEFRVIDIVSYVNNALRRLRGDSERKFGSSILEFPTLLKGERGVSNEKRVVEPIEKGILRAVNNVYVNKDGTVRLDLTEMPITHFKPKEIGTSIDKLIELGYTHDIFGKPLETPEQVVELKPQDIILPDCNELPETDIARDILNITHFIDDLLEKVYGLPRYYNAKSKSDLVGSLFIALAPHTSAGILAMLIGFTKTQGGMAHPYLHSACRRDADGDELGFMLLLDAFINFSHDYLPNIRGTKNMDCPLVLSLFLNPGEVDDEVFDMDRVWEYPLEFYYDTLQFKHPKDVDIDVVDNHLEKESQYEGFGFTHPVNDFNKGNVVSSYKTLATMNDKVEKQMDIASKVRAINSSDVATMVIERHFLRDIKGNLRKFSTQTFRCINCNEKYRRIPLSNKCLVCDGKIVLTIHEGSVVKYVEQCMALAEKYTVSPYLSQSLDLLKRRIESVFGKETEKQEKLLGFF